MTDHRAMAERALGAIDASDDPRNLPAGLDGIGRALLAIHDTLTEIRDRLPEPEAEQEDAEDSAIADSLVSAWKPSSPATTSGVRDEPV